MKTPHGLCCCQVVCRAAFSEYVFPLVFGLETKGSKKRALTLLCPEVNNISLIFEIWQLK